MGKKRFSGFFLFLQDCVYQGLEQGYKYGDPKTSGELELIEKLFSKFHKDIVYFDVGANEGFYAKEIARILKNKKANIYCFEPVKDTFAKLKDSCGSIQNVQLHQLGFSSKKETVTIYKHDSLTGLSSVAIKEMHGLSLSNEEQIAVTTLDLYMAENAMEHIHYLKLDVEGLELEVLKGAEQAIAEDKIDMIQFEMGRPNVHSRTFYLDFYNTLHAKYSLYKIQTYGLLPMGEYIYTQENFLGSNYLAVRKDSEFHTVAAEIS